ncbi:MAG: DUF5455 family protein [Nitrosomonadales bacterium]
MPAIISFFTWLASTLTGWAVAYFGRKVTTAVTAIAGFVLLTAALVVCLKQGILYLLGLTLLPSWVSAGVGMFLPYDFAAVLASIWSAKACRWAYDLALEKLKLVNSAT